jgi:hypothetical protein
MTSLSKPNQLVSLGDRFSELAVIVVTVVALVLGTLLKTSVENRSLPFQGGGISAQTPAGWIVETPAANEVLRVSDRTTTGFGTTYIVEEEAVPSDSSAAQFAGLLTLRRGTDLTAYRVLDQQDVLVGGRQAVQIEYVFVASAANLAHAVLPSVVHGLDYVFVENGKAVIVTVNADQSLFEASRGRFNRFLVSVQF